MKLVDESMQSLKMSPPCEHRLRRHDGQYRWFSSEMTPILDRQGTLIQWLGTSTDIHDSKLSAERLIQTQKMEAIGQLTGGLAHNFNNLLAIIIGNLDMIASNLTDERGARRVQVALRAAERGAALVKSLLALASRQVLAPQIIELRPLLEGMAPLIQQALGVRVHLVLEFCAQPVLVLVDVSGLESVLLNLVVNARDAMPDGGVFTVNVAVSPPEWATMTLSDSGSGMAPQVLSRAMEPFYTTKASDRGTGLGLATVAGFVQQSSGHIRLQSIPGHGTTVGIDLPLASSGLEASPAAPTALQTTPNKPLVILVVDDEAELVALVCDYAHECGYTTLSAQSSETALAVLAREHVDMIISDVVMPGRMDGLALVAQVQKRYPLVAVLLMSGFSKDTLAVSRSHTWPLLVKPFRQADFRAAVDALLHPGSLGKGGL